MEAAHSYVFGAKNVPEKTKNSKPQQVKLTKDPNYEPDDAEMANAEEEEIVADEEQGYIAENLSNKGKFEMDRHDDLAKKVCTDIIQNDNVDEGRWKRLVDSWFDEHYQKTQRTEEEEIGAIVLYKISHTNKDGFMSDTAHDAYVKMVKMKMGPHMEHEPVKSDLQIVEQVIKEHSSSRSSTFLSSVGVSANSRRTSTSNARIKELEARLPIQEQQAVDASAKYQEEMEKRMQAQEGKFQELERKQAE
ncbi:hypothetical protein QYE76_059758 [Lolium multiflorum]|uniref:Uncharacterized protein n=1 Tax=Lolium multiflorum TaxID=4521 RepID=A0AAD8RZ85_LOLMU|nr:hypothetical protein QYE76_059758 [Lolium multiflorum]